MPHIMTENDINPIETGEEINSSVLEIGIRKLTIDNRKSQKSDYQ